MQGSITMGWLGRWVGEVGGGGGFACVRLKARCSKKRRPVTNGMAEARWFPSHLDKWQWCAQQVR